MAQSAGLHEAAADLDAATIDRHRAIVSLQEEFEATDWYDQRVHATSDASLAAIMAHNRDEEKEHAAMTLEWLRRRDEVLDQHLRTYLWTTLPITDVERMAAAGGADAGARAGDAGGVPPRGGTEGSLRIGSLRGVDR